MIPERHRAATMKAGLLEDIGQGGGGRQALDVVGAVAAQRVDRLADQPGAEGGVAPGPGGVDDAAAPALLAVEVATGDEMADIGPAAADDPQAVAPVGIVGA